MNISRKVRSVILTKMKKIGGIMHGCQKVLENITSGYGNHKKKY